MTKQYAALSLHAFRTKQRQCVQKQQLLPTALSEGGNVITSVSPSKATDFELLHVNRSRDMNGGHQATVLTTDASYYIAQRAHVVSEAAL